MQKCNCWEETGCDRTLGNGDICKAACESQFAGINGGTASGRICWSVAGTMGNNTCTCLTEIESCYECWFFHKVHREEIRGGTFVMSVKGSG